MSRYDRPLPFSAAMEFVAHRVFRLNGVDYLPGQRIDKAGLSDRLLRSMYEARKILPVADAAPAAPAEVKTKRGRTKRGDSSDGAAARVPLAPDEARPPAPASAPAGDDLATSPVGEPSYTVVKPAMGDWRVLDASGAPVGEPYATEAEALAALEALTAAG